LPQWHFPGLSEIVPQLQLGPQSQMYFPFKLTVFTDFPQPHFPGSLVLRSQLHSAPQRQKIPLPFSISATADPISSCPGRTLNVI
jgi:hypothetical protein